MALLFMESFDGTSTSSQLADKYATYSSIQTDLARTGPNSGQGSWTRNITPATSTIVFGIAYYFTGALMGVILQDSGSNQCSVGLNADGSVSVRRGHFDGGTNIQTTAIGAVITSSWNFIEAKLEVANSASYEVKLNGVSVLSGSGVDLQSTGTSAITSILMSTYFSGSARMDDVFVLDTSGSYLNDFIGDHKVEVIRPDGNGTNTGWTPSTGTNHAAVVDETAGNDDTDYLYANTVGVKDTMTFGNISSSALVKAVAITGRMRKTDTPTKEFCFVTRMGSTDYDGATKALASTTYSSQYEQILERRPSDSAAWTATDVNNAEFGVKIVT